MQRDMSKTAVIMNNTTVKMITNGLFSIKYLNYSSYLTNY